MPIVCWVCLVFIGILLFVIITLGATMPAAVKYEREMRSIRERFKVARELADKAEWPALFDKEKKEREEAVRRYNRRTLFLHYLYPKRGVYWYSAGKCLYL